MDDIEDMLEAPYKAEKNALSNHMASLEKNLQVKLLIHYFFVY